MDLSVYSPSELSRGIRETQILENSDRMGQIHNFTDEETEAEREKQLGQVEGS